MQRGTLCNPFLLGATHRIKHTQPGRARIWRASGEATQTTRLPETNPKTTPRRPPKTIQATNDTTPGLQVHSLGSSCAHLKDVLACPGHSTCGFFLGWQTVGLLCPKKKTHQLTTAVHRYPTRAPFVT